MSKTIKKIRQKPELITINNRQVSSNGRFNPGLMADYVSEHGREDWLDLGDLARAAYHQNIDRSRRAAARALPRLFWVLFQRGDVLIYEYGEHGRIQAIKICNAELEEDRQCAEAKLDRMKTRMEMTSAQYEQALVWLQVHTKAIA